MAITATERTQIEQLVVLMFNAAPGATYLSQVVSIYESLGHNLAALANTLDDTDAYRTLNPNFQTAAEFATKFLTPLGLQGDSFAVSYIVDKFNAGESKGQIVYEALQALNTVTSGAAAQYVKAKAILDNKVAVAEYYSVTQGVAQTDLNVLQLVLAGVNETAASVTAAETAIANGTLGVSGIQATLTPQQDTVTGSPGADTVAGLFGDMTTAANNTFTSGDSLDGAGGTDTLNLTVVQDAGLHAPVSPAVIIKNFEVINIQDTSTTGATFNEALVENSPAINFTNTVSGATAMVTNASLGSVIGLNGAGNLTVAYSSTSGSADTANLSLNSASAATIDVSNSNTVEAVKIATAGTNVATLNLGTAAATITVTGNGTNTFTIGSDKTTATIDASASTGTNTFNLGTTLTNGDVVKGGTGTDTASFTANAAIGIVTFTGVETLKGTFNADALLNLGSSTGVKTISLTQTTNATITNATSDLTALNVTSVTGTENLTLDYKDGQTGLLTATFGSTATSAAAINIGTLELGNVGNLTLAGVGTKPINFTTVDLDDTTTSITVSDATAGGVLNVNNAINAGDALTHFTMTAGAGAAIDVNDVEAAGSENVAVSVNAGASGYAWTEWVSASSFDTVTLSLGAGASGGVEVGSDGDVGNVSATIATDASGFTGVYAGYYGDGTGGNVGDLTMSIGDDGTGILDVDTAGTVGDINVTVASGGFASAGVYAGEYGSGGNDATIGNVNVTLASGAVMGSGWTGSGFSGTFFTWSAGLDIETYSGSIGDVTVTVGADAQSYSYLYASSFADASGAYAGGGDIGNITVSVDGDDGVAYISAYASGSEYSAGTAGDPTGGNIGNIELSADGRNAYVSGYFMASGGDVGNISATAGTSAGVDFGVWAYDSWSAGFGNVGDIAVSVGTNGHSSGGAYGESGVGNATVSLEDGAMSDLWLQTDGSGDVGTLTVTGGDDAWFSGYTYGANVGNQSVTMGQSGYVALTNYADTMGTVTVNMGTGSAGVYVTDYASAAGEVLVAGGDTGSFASVYVGANSVDQIDLSGWLGTYSINASVSVGTVILVGAAGGTAYGGGGADVMTGGAGADALYGNAGADVITGGAGADTIDGGAGLDVLTGGTGNDIYYVDSSGDVINEDSTGGTADVVHSTASTYTLSANIETLSVEGSSAGQAGTGNSGANTITTTNGSGTSLDGGAGADTITGGAGNDTIAGGAGVDSMTGGSGTDTFTFTGSNVATAVAIGSAAVTDTITDFAGNVGTATGGEMLDFATSGTSSNYHEDLATAASFTALLTAADAALDGTVQYYFGVTGGNGYLLHSTDGTNVDAVIKLTGVTDMDYAQII